MWTSFQTGFRPGRRFRLKAGLQLPVFLNAVALEYRVHPEPAGSARCERRSGLASPGPAFRLKAGLQLTDIIKDVELEYRVHPEPAG